MKRFFATLPAVLFLSLSACESTPNEQVSAGEYTIISYATEGEVEATYKTKKIIQDDAGIALTFTPEGESKPITLRGSYKVLRVPF